MKVLLFVLILLESAYALSAKLDTELIYKGSDIVWGFDFLPNGHILVTEKKGELRLFDPKTNKTITVTGVPEVDSDGQGGLLDILVDRNFSKNKTIYLTYSAPIKGGQTTRLVSATLDKNSLKNITPLFTATPGTRKSHHYGSRVIQDKDGWLFLTVGDRGERKLAQDKSKRRGKLYRISSDGKSELWSYGHRNAQGADIHPLTQEIWTVEHGPRGGDELNKISKSKNYGWPVITYGKEYWGPSIGEGTAKAGMEQPKFHFTPSIAASGLMIYSGKMFTDWKGHFFVGALKDTHISLLHEVNGEFKELKKLFEENKERVRQIKEASDGSIYYSTDNGKIIRLFKKLKTQG